MSKKKRSKVIQMPPSPEKYIRTRCRNLPIGTCYINNGWKENGMAYVFITRKHSNDNITVGIYLVDTYCLGVKDSYYKFNISPFELDEIINDIYEGISFAPIDYVLAHNIVYGAIGYAEDYGFSPHKDFTKVTQFILEEDDDNVVLMELEYGRNGKPFLIIQDEDEPYLGYIKTLEETAGEGNFEYMLPSGEGSDGYEVDDDDFFMYRFYDDDIEENIQREIDEINEMSDEKHQKSFENEDFLDKTYNRMIEINFASTVSAEEKREASEFGEKLFDIKFYNDGDIEGIGEITNKNDLRDYSEIIQFLAANKPKKALKKINILMGKQPENTTLIFYMILALLLDNKMRKADELILSAYQKYPNDLEIRTQYLDYLIRNKRFEEMEDILKSGCSIKDIYPNTELFDKGKVLSYYKTIFKFLIDTKQMLKARVIFFHLEKLGVPEDEMDIYHEMIIDNTMLFIEENN